MGFRRRRPNSTSGTSSKLSRRKSFPWTRKKEERVEKLVETRLPRLQPRCHCYSCSELYCPVLYCAVQYCAVVYWGTMYCTVLHIIVQHCKVLHSNSCLHY